MPVTSPHMTILTTPLESGRTAKPSWVYSRAFAVLRCGSPNCVTNCFTVIPATTFPTRTLGSISEGSPGCAETTWLDLSEQAVRKTSTPSVQAIFIGRPAHQSLDRSLESNRSSSRYNHTSVTSNAIPQYHSIYFGEPVLTPFSIMAKSISKLNAAIPAMTTLIPIPNGPDS